MYLWQVSFEHVLKGKRLKQDAFVIGSTSEDVERLIRKFHKVEYVSTTKVNPVHALTDELVQLCGMSNRDRLIQLHELQESEDIKSKQLGRHYNDNAYVNAYNSLPDIHSVINTNVER